MSETVIHMRVVAVLLVIGLCYLCWVIVDTVQYRREMACRDHWPDKPTPEECAKLLRESLPKSKDARVQL